MDHEENSEIHLQNLSPQELALADLVSRLTDRVQAGETIDFEQICRESPEHADELKELWGAILVTHAVAVETRIWASPANVAEEVSRGFTVPKLPFIIGDYELLEVIGRGGMGVVYRAQQRSLNRTVAVKMIHDDRPSSLENRQRFFAEAEATARLEHPGIVPVFEVAEHEGHPFFSMQFVPGETLAERLKQGPLPQRLAAKVMVDVARAIHYAHDQGVLHRDIKPSNILIDEFDRVRVTDFGLAKLSDSADSLTRSGAVIGTPSYMSPEQASGRTPLLGPRSDVYSLGTVLYHSLTGRPPFIADSPMELALQVLELDPPPVRLLEPGLDRDLEMIVSKSLQKPPDLRYKSAGALADDLESFLRDEPVQARSGKLGQVAARWFRETHHAIVLENWGLLWMWHSLVLLIVCVATEILNWLGSENRLSYAALWVVGLGTWAAVFWALRRRMGPVTFVERQIAHIWGASLIAIAALTPLEWLLDLAPLTLSPILALVGGMVFFIKAGILAGWFYIQAACLLITSFLMALLPDYAHLIFGLISAACFFLPGLKYYRQRRANELSTHRSRNA
ncbi:serine/threonine-protein kinase [Aureliella helgolandensis]|uniref:non-specific serine/threonine protein kinase n=1 Tax=Aureliella helgolandensis TaxID=2527968 RepID=A0A518GC18_9BACT|nr:serine/threonine-protein kinase [Aureliella helgolandensis]QDV26107.1 Serine/threonine-protein kinase PknB [Aureliella helgolandensis]